MPPKGDAARRGPRHVPQGGPAAEAMPPLPWVGGLALVGVALSIYLAVTYYLGSAVPLCATGPGCDEVQSSPYAAILGVPVALIGVLGYGAVALLSLVRRPVPWRWHLLYLLALAGLAFSVYLTYLELTAIRALCSYCLASLGIALLIFVLVLRQGLRGGLRVLVPVAALATLGVLLVAVGGPALVYGLEHREEGPLEFQVALAQYLAQEGVAMYGAYWCGACAAQKRLFGDAFRYVDYVECDPGGQNSRYALCTSKGMRAYPTWEIKGEFYEGVRSLEELALLSGYWHQ